MSVEWTDVHDKEIVYIFKFDDGVVKYKNVYPNTWIIIAKWRGKIRLKHTHSDTVIKSISEWKVSRAFIPDLSVKEPLQ